MSHVEKALGLFAINRMQEYALRNRTGTSYYFTCPGNRGFCEGCQSMKPAPKGRKKHWRCTDCRKTKTKG